MLAIILLSIAVVITFIVMVVLIINLIVTIVQKKKEKMKSAIIAAVSVFILWIILGCINAFVIVSYIFEHREEIIDSGIHAGAEFLAKGLVLTYKGIEKNWDAEVVKRMKNITIDIVKTEVKIEKDEKIYSIELLFTNTNPGSDRISLRDLIIDNYLVVCDRDDVMYGLEPSVYQSYYLPAGKTKSVFNVSVEKEVELRYIRFIDNKIEI
jgi:heme/copper-type cytochrome/quinol oxidase subunit 2